MPSLKAMAREAQTKPRASAPQNALNRKQTIFKSAERVADSDLESETESDTESEIEEDPVVMPMPLTTTNGQKPKAVAVAVSSRAMTAEDDEEHEGESEEDTVIYGSHTTARGQASDESGSESYKGSYSERELNKAHENGEAEAASKKISSLRKGIRAESDEPTAIPTYNPPDGFTILSEFNEGRQKVADVFGQPNLAGKQLWYITAPASVPISAVKQVSLQDAQLGKPAFSFAGHVYGFVHDQAKETGFIKVLIPERNNNAYRIGQRVVDQTLHLQQIVQVHEIRDVGSQNSRVPTTLATRPIRKQPKGLKLRFHPIGFGTGKSGTIGPSSSSSDASNDTDSDVDEEIENTPLVREQNFDLDQANSRLSEHTPKDSDSQDDTSSSGEEIDSPLTVAPVGLPLSSDGVSGTSNDEMKHILKSTSAAKQPSTSPSQLLKRKLSEFEKDDEASNTPYRQSRTNDTTLKKANIRNLAQAQKVPAFSVNGIARNTDENTPYISPSKISRVPPPQVPETHSDSVNSLEPKVTPVPPPRQLSILPAGGRSKSTGVTKDMKVALPRLEKSSVSVSGAQLPSVKETQRRSEDLPQSSNPEVTEKQKKKMHRLHKKAVSNTSESQRTELMNDSSSSRNACQHPIEARSPTKLSANKISPQDAILYGMVSTKKVSKKSKKHHSSITVLGEDRGTGSPIQETSTPMPSPRKESVILPPKIVRLTSR